MEMTTRRPVADLVAEYGEQAVAIELELEARMATIGRDQVYKQIEAARATGNEGSTRYGQTLISRAVEDVAGAITRFVEEAKGKPGKKHIAVRYLPLADPEVVAYIALRCVVDGLCGTKKNLQRVGVEIGKRLEDEVRFSFFEQEDKKSFKRAQDKAKKAAQYHRKTATMAGHERRALDSEWVSWPEQDRLHVGTKLIDIIEQHGLIEVGTKVTTKRDTTKIIEPTAKLVEWIEREVEKSEFLAPAHMPMAVKPLDWTTPFDGGYFTELVQSSNTLVKVRNSNYLTELQDRADEMPMVYESINALQSTRWQINATVHRIANEMWSMANDGSVLPPREDNRSVPCPACGQSVNLPKLNTRGSVEHACFDHDETGEQTLREWKRQATKAHKANVALRSKRLVTAKTLKVADIYGGSDAIYFPYQLDFRGRIYAIPTFNPQGADLTKGLLHFADGMAIEDGVAAGWLAIQGANTYGFDKADFEDRIQWVADHEEGILESARDPHGCAFWKDADKPWQFLAFCIEWLGFNEQGYGFVSHLPVALDGSCSGIQHFSAMLRDEEGGEAVNLIPQKLPADIYQKVCNRVVLKLEEEAAANGSTIAQAAPPKADLRQTPPSGQKPNKMPKADPKVGPEDEDDEVIDHEEDQPEVSISSQELAQGWLKMGLSRKTTKRQVMTLPYGATLFSCRGYTEEWMRDQFADGVARPWDERFDFKATQYLSALIWASIGEVVVAARQAMDWLQGCARVVAKEGLPVYWQTPSGFPVMQKYNEYNSRRVKTKIGDAIVKLSLQEETDIIDQRRMANAISPNFVHSMDATHLVVSTCYGVNNDINHYAMIHDSFGTHAANTEMLAACLREAFVSLYHGKDVLEDFRQQILLQVEPESQAKIRPVPTKGDLDVSVVRDSQFFFA